MKSRQCNYLFVLVQDGILAQEVTGLADAQDQANFGVNPDLRNELRKLLTKIIVIWNKRVICSKFVFIFILN